MAKRESKKVVTGVTEEQFYAAMAAYAHADAEADKHVAKLNAEIAKVRERYDPPIAACMEAKELNWELMQIYCSENKPVLFSDKRHIETTHGKVGFRFGTPKLKTLPKFTWDKVLDKVKQLMPEFVRTKEELNKEAILMNRNELPVRERLNDMGVYVDNDEHFYVELKKEEQPVAA